MKKETKAAVVKALTAAVIMIVLIFVILYQNRDLSLGSAEILVGGGEGSRVIEGYGGGVTAAVGKKNLLVTTNTFLLMDENGKGKAIDISVSNPEVWVCGDYILIYDSGAHQFILYEGSKLVYESRFEADIISAKVNEKGYVIIAGEENSGETTVMVHNKNASPIYSWRLGSGEFVDMDLCADNSRMVISSVDSGEEELRGCLTVVALDSEEKMAACFKSDEIYFNVVINRDHTIAALGSEQLDFYNSDASIRWSLDYGGKTLRNANILNSDAAVLAFASADSGLMGNSTQIEVVNRLGEITASAGIDGLSESLSVNGDMFAVSAGKKVYIFTDKCELKRELTCSSQPKSISLFKSGRAVFALSSGSGSIVRE